MNLTGFLIAIGRLMPGQQARAYLYLCIGPRIIPKIYMPDPKINLLFRNLCNKPTNAISDPDANLG